MLSRTAANLYWIGRYIERADATARLLDMARRLSLVSGGAEAEDAAWAAVLISAGALPVFPPGLEGANGPAVAQFLALDPDAPCSIRGSLAQARGNARTVRMAMTTEIWEAINDTWLELKSVGQPDASGRHLVRFLDWVRGAGAKIAGSIDATMIRHDGYDFLLLGRMIERADQTARLIDVRHHLLAEARSDAFDYYVAFSMLRAAGSLRAFRWQYGGDPSPPEAAEFLLLEARSPRSIRHALEEAAGHLDWLERLYDRRHLCHDRAAAMLDGITPAAWDALPKDGLHGFLNGIMADCAALSDAIAQAYGFKGALGDSDAKSA